MVKMMPKLYKDPQHGPCADAGKEHCQTNYGMKFAPSHLYMVLAKTPSTSFTSKPLKPCGVVKVTPGLMLLSNMEKKSTASKSTVKKLPMLLLHREKKLMTGLKDTIPRSMTASAVINGVTKSRAGQREKLPSASGCTDQFPPVEF